MSELDEKYYRPSQDQLEKIVPKIESETTTNVESDNYVSVDLIDPTQKFYNSQFDSRIDALVKRVSELEQENRNIKHSLSELGNDIKKIHTAFKNIYNVLQDYITR